MGDRVVAHVFSLKDREIGPAVYLHNGAYRFPRLVDELRDRMHDRRGDVSYASARLIGLAHEAIPGNLSLGTWNAPHEGDPVECWEAITSEDYSHGDGGVVLINCDDFSAYACHGYLSTADVRSRGGIDSLGNPTQYPAPPATWGEMIESGTESDEVTP